MTTQPDISVVIPVLNEVGSLPQLYDELTTVLRALGRPYEIIFVDDGSLDSTFEKSRMLAQKNPRLRIVKFRRNFGQTPAMCAGFDHARGTVVITMDGDLQNDPPDIPKLLQKI